MKIEMGGSIFGKYNIFVERHIIRKIFEEVEKGVFFINPKLTHIEGVEYIPIEKIIKSEKRKEMALNHFRRAKKLLEELGV